MKKTVPILIIIIVLLSGCISKMTDNNKIYSGGDEYADDGTTEETSSDIVQADYNNLDLNSKNSKMPDVSNVTQENITNSTVDDIATKT